MTFLRTGIFVAWLLLGVGCGGGDGAGPGSSGTGGAGGTGGTAGAGAAGRSACAVEVPAAYPAVEFEASAAPELELITRFQAMLQPMKDAELDPAVAPTAAELGAAFAAGTPSLRSVTSSYYAARIDGLFATFETAAGRTWAPAEPPPAEGGMYSKWIFDARGRDLRQAIEKGMFGATFYRHAATLAGGTVDAAVVDRILAVYGAHPSFPQDDQHPDHPDRLAAQYAKRRDDPSTATPGLYRQLAASFRAARAYAAAGAPCAADRDAAVAALFSAWERVLFASVVYYANDAAKKLTVDPPTDADLAAGLHGVGEMAGFVHGFRELEAGARRVTDAQLDELLALLGAPPTGEATTYQLATDTASRVGRLSQVSVRVQDIYGFSHAELEAFETNY